MCIPAMKPCTPPGPIILWRTSTSILRRGSRREHNMGKLWRLLQRFPPPLRKQALLRFAGAGACFVLLIATALVYRDPALCWPFLLCGTVCAGLGVLLVRRTAQGRYVVLEGAVQKVEKTLFRSRPKAVIIARDGRLVKVYLRGRRWGLAEGDRLRLYVADNTP